MMSCTTKLIALYGRPWSGKDEVAKHLVEKHGWVRVAFADPLREMLVALDPVLGQLNDGTYVHLSNLLPGRGIEGCKREFPEVRRLLQQLGTEAGRDVLGADVWVNHARRVIDGHMRDGKSVVVTDTRFPNEYQFMRDMGATIIRIDRPGTSPVRRHTSEQHYSEFTPDFVIDNSKGILDLYAKADEIVSACIFTDAMSVNTTETGGEV